MIHTKKKFDFGIYPTEFTVIICDKIQEALDDLNVEIQHKNIDAGCLTLEEDDGYYEYALIFESRALSISIISHECVHLANKVFGSIGHGLDPDNDECYAYLQGWIVRQVCELIEDQQLFHLIKFR